MEKIQEENSQDLDEGKSASASPMKDAKDVKIGEQIRDDSNHEAM